MSATEISSKDEAERSEIRRLLTSGVATDVYPRADTHEQVQAIIAKLRSSDHSLRSRLIIGGFTLDAVDHHGIEQACESCMYYVVHRRYCELPELNCAVEPQWSCRLWRI